MPVNLSKDVPWIELSEFIAEHTGLHFPVERRLDLQRSLIEIAKELGFPDEAACAQWLLSHTLTEAQSQVLSSHLTVGETYFFREPNTFDTLRESILPQLLRAKANGERRLRIWSAACCTGEEAYSLAILLDQMIPDRANWQVTILATDINAQFLAKASAGEYGEWSFRNAPDWLKESYFRRTKAGRYAILPEIRKQVTFTRMNLTEDISPASAINATAMDIVFCRNVLMYFTPTGTRKALANLHHALVDGGWLAVSPSDGSRELFSAFAPANFPGTAFYQKGNLAKKTLPVFDYVSATHIPALFIPPPVATPAPPASQYGPAFLLFQQGRCAEAAEMLLSSLAGNAVPHPSSFSLLARALANQGRLAEASKWCERWVSADKLDPIGHYICGVVLLELGEHEQARDSLQRALYLDPKFIMAHFGLANLARAGGKTVAVNKHFATLLRLLRNCPPDEILPESDGLTAGRLIHIINSLMAPETTT